MGQLPLEVSMDTVTLAFSFSKMQFVDELEQIDNYERLFFVEFLEFIGRLAYLVWPSLEESFDVKLWRLLQIMFGQIRAKVEEPTV